MRSAAFGFENAESIIHSGGFRSALAEIRNLNYAGLGGRDGATGREEPKREPQYQSEQKKFPDLHALKIVGRFSETPISRKGDFPWLAVASAKAANHPAGLEAAAPWPIAAIDFSRDGLL